MIVNMPVHMIMENPWQVRQEWEQEAIEELAQDIQANGLLQAPLGRLIHMDGRPLSLAEMSQMASSEYARLHMQLAFGHRRLKAYIHNKAKLGTAWARMPVEIRVMTDEQMAAYAWSENEKRRDLTPMERARAIYKRMECFNWTQEQAAEKLGISRSRVAGLLRLLNLPEEIQDSVQEGEISERQAQAIYPIVMSTSDAGDNGQTELKEELVQAAKDGVSSNELRERAKEAREESTQNTLAGLDAKMGIESEKQEKSPVESKLLCDKIYARAVTIIKDALEIDDPRAWRLILRHIDMDYRQKPRNWKLEALRWRVAMKLVENPFTHRSDPAEAYMQVRDLFRAVDMEMPSYDEVIR